MKIIAINKCVIIVNIIISFFSCTPISANRAVYTVLNEKGRTITTTEYQLAITGDCSNTGGPNE